MNVVTAEMSATVWKLTVPEGAEVASGDTIAILESMKMEIPVEVDAAGTVRFKVTEGSEVAEGTVIAELR